MTDRRKHIMVIPMEEYIPSDAELRAEQLLKIAMQEDRKEFDAEIARLDDCDKLLVLSTRRHMANLLLTLAVWYAQDQMRKSRERDGSESAP